MQLHIANPPDNALTLLRRAGYSEYYDKNTGKYSFSKRLGADFFPKYHLYVQEGSTDLVIDLHVDQKQVSYAGSNKHSGEYEGPLVEREIERIKNFVATHKKSGDTPQKKGFFAGLFGGSGD